MPNMPRPRDHSNGHSTWLRQQFTLGNILTALAMMIGGAVAYGDFREEVTQIKATVARDSDDRAIRRAQVDERLRALATQAQEVPGLTYRMGQQEGQIKALIDRMTRGFDLRLEAEERAAERTNKLTTQVEVMSSRLETVAKAIERMEARGRAQPPWREGHSRGE